MKPKVGQESDMRPRKEDKSCRKTSFYHLDRYERPQRPEFIPPNHITRPQRRKLILPNLITQHMDIRHLPYEVQRTCYHYALSSENLDCPIVDSPIKVLKKQTAFAPNATTEKYMHRRCKQRSICTRCADREVFAPNAQTEKYTHKTCERISVCTECAHREMYAQNVESKKYTLQMCEHRSVCTKCTRRKVYAPNVQTNKFSHKMCNQISACTERACNCKNLSKLGYTLPKNEKASNATRKPNKNYRLPV